MKIKPFIILIYTLAGLVISALTAFMTFMIIGTPIGMKMIIQILLAIVFVLPIVIFISYFFGRYLSRKFNFIEKRLQDIKDENFKQSEQKNLIVEINEIHQNINFVSNRLDTLISDLKQKNQNLSDLLVSMAHDVKTPITILNGYIEEIEDELIQKEDLPSVLNSMKQEVEFLNELTVDMLEFISSMNNHKVQNNIKVKKLVDDEIFPLLAKRGDIKYINDINEGFELLFNKVDLKKIFLNILNNALKFTKNGYIKVGVSNDMILFQNNGEEIKKEYQEKIFEPFFTICKSKNRKTTGFGLGLSIVKNLSKNNGYECYLESSTKEKTIFIVKIQNKKLYLIFYIFNLVYNKKIIYNSIKNGT